MRYVVVSEYVGRGRHIHFIVDDLINRMVGEGFAVKKDADRICKELNKGEERKNAERKTDKHI